MTTRLQPLAPLKGEQLAASDPRANVWLSASAGTGKTHVLTARVLRLLLQGVDPSSILCLTFTKAGAAEMAQRIHARLAWWVRLDPARLKPEIFALTGHDAVPLVERARALFARVLEATGGGLRIQTIHAFCQTLLAGFPAEAGLAPGFRPIEGREAAALGRQVLAELLVEAEAGGELGLIADVQALSRRLGEARAEAYLASCARDPDAMAALGPGVAARVRAALDVPLGDVDEVIEALCRDDAFDCEALSAVMAANRAWGTPTGAAAADTAAGFLAAHPCDRAALVDEVIKLALTAKGEPKKIAAKLLAHTPDYEALAARLAAACQAVSGLRSRAALATLLGAGLRAGQAYARRYAEAKRAAGLVDFDDLIRAAVRLLETDGMGDWVRYKLDQQTDHILVDEAQDTNARQWSIVAALAGEFFAGAGAKSPRGRTIFTVGDTKQAIFGFQGTNPQAFQAARLAFEARARDAERPFADLGLDRSFRSTPPVLELVDKLIEEVGPAALGLGDAPRPHVSFKGGPGTVTLWRPHSAGEADPDEAGEEGWIDDATRGFATRLARQIRAWLDEPLMLESRGRPLRPEDVLVLVRKRGTLASLLVARLHAEGVPVAGVDRLRLDAPLAVQDLMAALRFAAQPGDDLTLAALLVSPLFGWSQERLHAAAFGRPRSLREAVRAHDAETSARLDRILARADFTTPFQLLEEILSGELDGRRRLLARLGAEARDPIEELLNAALAFEGEATPTLQRFLDWFDRGEVEVVRDAAAPADAVRVMTVHGAKGLQAPLVVLADATVDPALKRADEIDWTLDEGAPPVPVFRPRKAELAGGLAADLARAERLEAEEHLRLLYVGLTRAEERLVIGGALGPKAKGEPPKASWYAAIERAMAGLGAEWVDDPLWSGARHHRGRVPAAARAGRRRLRREPPVIAEPDWLRRAAPEEARPPRPLAPSALGIDDPGEAPPAAAMRDAALRGRALHGLFERLPAVAPERRAEAGRRWLAAEGIGDDAIREALVADACAIIADPRFAALFGPDGLAEAPIAAVVDGEVIAGTVDRLLVSEAEVQIVDFKTGRRVPRAADEVPDAHRRQMGAYAAALAAIFPGRAIRAALLYTAGPRLIELPAAALVGWKPDYGAAEQKLGDGG